MSSRHTRRKLAKAKALAKLEGLAQAERSRRIAATVKANKSSPVSRKAQIVLKPIEGTPLKEKVYIPAIDRNFYPQSCMATLQEKSARGYVARNVKASDYLPHGSVARGFNRG